MNENKCCGNCKHFKDEDVEGVGFCEDENAIVECDDVCINHKLRNNGWTEITPDNECYITDEVINRAVVGWFDSRNRWHIVAFADCSMGVGTMAKFGGYYYYVLPELKKEESK